MRKLFYFFVCLLLFWAAGCGEEKTAGPEPAVRFYSASSAASHLLLKLGAADALVAVDRYGRAVPGAERIPVAGSGSAVSVEKLAELGVSRAFVWYYQTNLKQLLEQHGIAVTVLPAVRLADYPGLVRTVASAAGKNAEGEALIAEFQTQLDATPPAGGERRRVYFELYSPYKCAGGDSYFGDLLKLAGAENIGEALPTGPVSPEYLVQSSPEVILFLAETESAETIAGRPGFAALPAVRYGRIRRVERTRVLEGVDPAEAVRYLRRLIRDR